MPVYVWLPLIVLLAWAATFAWTSSFWKFPRWIVEAICFIAIIIGVGVLFLATVTINGPSSDGSPQTEEKYRSVPPPKRA